MAVFGAGPVEAAVTNAALNFEVAPDKRRMAGYGSLADVLNTLELAVSNRAFLVGDRFSAADLYLGAQIGWGMQFGTVERRPAFERYWAGMADRPAAVRARAIDDGLLAANRAAAPA